MLGVLVASSMRASASAPCRTARRAGRARHARVAGARRRSRRRVVGARAGSAHARARPSLARSHGGGRAVFSVNWGASTDRHRTRPSGSLSVLSASPAHAAAAPVEGAAVGAQPTAGPPVVGATSMRRRLARARCGSLKFDAAGGIASGARPLVSSRGGGRRSLAWRGRPRGHAAHRLDDPHGARVGHARAHVAREGGATNHVPRCTGRTVPGSPSALEGGHDPRVGHALVRGARRARRPRCRRVRARLAPRCAPRRCSPPRATRRCGTWDLTALPRPHLPPLTLAIFDAHRATPSRGLPSPGHGSRKISNTATAAGAAAARAVRRGLVRARAPAASRWPASRAASSCSPRSSTGHPPSRMAEFAGVCAGRSGARRGQCARSTDRATSVRCARRPPLRAMSLEAAVAAPRRSTAAFDRRAAAVAHPTTARSPPDRARAAAGACRPALGPLLGLDPRRRPTRRAPLRAQKPRPGAPSGDATGA